MNSDPDSEHEPVRVDITRWDLVTLNLAITPRLRSTWLAWGFVAACAGGIEIAADGYPTTARAWFGMVTAMLLVATVFSTVMFGITLCAILFMSGTANGVIGEHIYVFTDHGLREQTSANDTLIRWNGVRDVRRTSRFILIGVSPALYHVLPRRCFESAAKYDEFWRAVRRLKHGGRPTPG